MQSEIKQKEAQKADWKTVLVFVSIAFSSQCGAVLLPGLRRGLISLGILGFMGCFLW